MPHKLRISATKAALLLALAITSAQASSDTTDQYCNSDYGLDPIKTARCDAYISGFLNGALLTDSAIVEHVTARDKTYSSFTERAYRTRVGSSREQLPATYMADFCLPAGKEVSSITMELAARLVANEGKQEVMAEALYEQIQADYPCAETDN